MAPGSRTSTCDASPSATQPAAALGPAAASAEIEDAESPPSFDLVPWAVRPSPGINYNFVSAIYLAGSAIALLFLAAEKMLLAPLLEGDGEQDAAGPTNASVGGAGEGDGAQEDGGPWREFARGMEGMHLIFAPFVPCLLWSLVVRHYWMKGSAVSPEKKDN